MYSYNVWIRWTYVECLVIYMKDKVLQTDMDITIDRHKAGGNKSIWPYIMRNKRGWGVKMKTFHILPNILSNNIKRMTNEQMSWGRVS